MHRTLSSLLILALAACSRGDRTPASSVAIDSAAVDSIARGRQDSINRTLPGYVVDSILPVQEELGRFRIAAGGDSVTTLRGGADSRDALVTQFVRALAASDTNRLRHMLLDAREFGWLVYPESPYTRPPYRQAPGLVWNQIQNRGASGMTRLLRRLGGQPLEYAGYSCTTQPERQGSNILWTGCVVRVRQPDGNTSERQLFGSIIERSGRFKFVSYTNQY